MKGKGGEEGQHRVKISYVLSEKCLSFIYQQYLIIWLQIEGLEKRLILINASFIPQPSFRLLTTMKN